MGNSKDLTTDLKKQIIDFNKSGNSNFQDASESKIICTDKCL